MIDNYLLEYLVAFAQTGTIAGAAEQLNITQPTVSRGLKKLETLLDVKLFDRQPQKLSLTATGKFTAQRARILLQQQHDFKKAVQHFASKNDYLRIAGTIPGPLLLLENIIERLDNQLVIETKIILPNNIESLLHNHNYALIFSAHEIQNADIESRFIGVEKLAIKITKFNPLYHRTTVNFNDLNGHEFVLSDNIGEWRKIIKQYISNAQFLYQAQPEALRELVHYSNFPIFKTNITNYLDERLAIVDRKRKFIPINDPHSAIELYATYLKNDRQKVTPLISEMTKILTQISD